MIYISNLVSPPMPDFFPIRCGAHFFVGSFIRRLARAERLRLQQGRTALFLATGDRQPGGHGNAAVLPKNLRRKYMT